jgi:hypothetical protein
MRYKHHLFMRGAKHFNPYEKQLIHHKSHHKSHHHHSDHHSDHELLNMLSLHHHKAKKSHKTGGSVKTRPYKPLRFTR